MERGLLPATGVIVARPDAFSGHREDKKVSRFYLCLMYTYLTLLTKNKYQDLRTSGLH